MKIRLKGDVNPEVASVLRDILPSKLRHDDQERQHSRERAINHKGPEPYPYKSSQFQDIRKKESQSSFNTNNTAQGKIRQYQPSLERIANNNSIPPNNNNKAILNPVRQKEEKAYVHTTEANQGVPTFQINLLKEPNFFIREVESLNYEEKYEVLSKQHN